MPICANLCHPWEIMFPQIALINTDIPSFRANPCSSVGDHDFFRKYHFF